ncbi:MAG: NDP-sugar synthase [Clostridia bacterium]|nr:NDP-sugar synthase [Clostridia bacterium]
MKAVILAGGRGERLRPITDTRPKPLVPVLARPVMDYCLSLLAHHGVTEAFVTTHYLADQIRHRYGKSAFGMDLSYSREDAPMGTAGAVKLLESKLLDEELFFVMSGDALCDFDLTEATRFHKEKKADVTIVLSSVKTPLEYGVVLADTFERIFAFAEKPDWSETFSDLVNTGVYILSPKILDRIPEGKTFDFARDLFPLLLREGCALYGYKDEGYWCDIGKIPALYRCNQDLLDGRVKTYLPIQGNTVPGADGKGHYFISDGAKVSKDAVIESGTVISPGATVDAGARASGALIMERAKLEQGALARDALLCENVTVREGAMALPGSILGAGSVMMPGAVSKRGKKYPPFSVISRLPSFREDSLVFTELGASAGTLPGLTSEDAQKLGLAFSHAFSGAVGVLWDEREAGSAYFATRFAAGVIKGGGEARLFGDGTMEMASFAASRYRLPVVFLSTADARGLAFAFREDGFSLLPGDAGRIARFHGEEGKHAVGQLRFQGGLLEQYVDLLAREMGHGGGRSLGFGGAAARYLSEAAIKSGWAAYNGTREKGVCLEVFDRGVKLFVDGEKIADTEKIRLYLIEKQLESGKREFLLPDTLPRLLGAHIESRGGKVTFFSLDHTPQEQIPLRAEGEKERWLYDHHLMTARLLGVIKEKSEETCRKEFRATPEIYVTQLRYSPKEENKAKLLGLVPRETAERGASVRIRPGFYGIRIVSEALSVEAALDHAFECRGKINEIEQKIGGR